MIVVMKTTKAGPDGNAMPGDKVEVDEKIGKQLVECGFAYAVGPVEVASVQPPENAQIKTPRARTVTKRGRK